MKEDNQYLHQTLDDDYLDEFIEKEKRSIEGRKVVSSFLLRMACQSTSCALAILLFQFAVQVWIVALLCYVVALAPVCTGLQIEQINEENWRVILMRGGIRTVIGLAIAIGFTQVKITETYSQISQTDKNLNKFLGELRAYEHPTSGQYELPPQGAILLAAIAIVFILGWLADKKGR